MAITRLGNYGGARQPYGSFSPKAEDVAGKSTDQLTRLGGYGGARQLYGTFSGKTPAVGGGKSTDQLTRLGLYGGARQLYGDFSGKTEGDSQVRGGKKRWSKRKKYELDDEKYSADAYLDNVGLEYETVTEVLNGIEVTSQKPVEPILQLYDDAPPLQSIADSVEREIANIMRTKVEYEHAILEFKYVEEVKKLDEEIFFIAMVLADED